MDLLWMVLASACFAVGGIFMKLSAGATRPGPVAAFSILFLVGALAQTKAMARAEMGVVYIAVLGLEAALALAFSTILFHEQYSRTRMLAVLLIIGGVLLLRRG